MARACSTNVAEECIGVIGGNTRRKETTKKIKRRWVDNINMDPRGIGWCDMN
jgi:hypothetical protein